MQLYSSKPCATACRGNTILKDVVVANLPAAATVTYDGCSGSIQVGGNITCTGRYTVQQADFEETEALAVQIKAHTSTGPATQAQSAAASVALLSSPQLFVDVLGYQCTHDDALGRHLVNSAQRING